MLEINIPGVILQIKILLMMRIVEVRKAIPRQRRAEKEAMTKVIVMEIITETTMIVLVRTNRIRIHSNKRNRT